MRFECAQAFMASVVADASTCARRRIERNREGREQTEADGRPIVFIVEDDADVRGALARLIERVGWRAKPFASAEQFLSQPYPCEAACLVLDATLPGMTGLAVQGLKANESAFLTKPFKDEALIRAIGGALKCSQAALRRDCETQILRQRYASLTRRQCEVMSLVVSGLQNKQIGWELGISEITVKAHRGQVMLKMQAESLPDLVTIAARLDVTSTAGNNWRTRIHEAHRTTDRTRRWRSNRHG